jgi:hypothetical protein
MTIGKNIPVLLAALAVTAQSVRANSVVLSQDPYSYDVGGEFSAAVTGGSFVQNYNSAATYNGGFETFCIETAVDFTPGTQYTYNLSQFDSQGRALTLGAAYLYYEFGSGSLSTLAYDPSAAGYDYTDTATRRQDAGLLQAAIWALQGGQSYPGYPSLTTDQFYIDAVDKFGGLTGAEQASDGAYGVDVFQMWDGDTAAQNQLVLVSTPDTSSTGLLFAGSAALVALFASRRRPELAPSRSR